MSPTAAKAASVRVAIEKCTTPVGGASKSRIFPVKLEEGGKKKMEKRRRKIIKNKNKATEITTKSGERQKPEIDQGENLAQGRYNAQAIRIPTGTAMGYYGRKYRKIV